MLRVGSEGDATYCKGGDRRNPRLNGSKVTRTRYEAEWQTAHSRRWYGVGGRRHRRGGDTASGRRHARRQGSKVVLGNKVTR